MHRGGHLRGPVVAGDVLDGAAAKDLAAVLVTLGATGKPDELIELPSHGASKAPLLVAVGLGAAPEGGAYGAEVLRRASGSATRALAGTAIVGIALPAESTDAVAAIAEGALFGAGVRVRALPEHGRSLARGRRRGDDLHVGGSRQSGQGRRCTG